MGIERLKDEIQAYLQMCAVRREHAVGDLRRAQQQAEIYAQVERILEAVMLELEGCKPPAPHALAAAEAWLRRSARHSLVASKGNAVAGWCASFVRAPHDDPVASASGATLAEAIRNAEQRLPQPEGE